MTALIFVSASSKPYACTILQAFRAKQTDTSPSADDNAKALRRDKGEGRSSSERTAAAASSDMPAHELQFCHSEQGEGESSRFGMSRKPVADELTLRLHQFQLSIDDILDRALLKFEERLERIVDKQMQRFDQTLKGLPGAEKIPAREQ